MYLQHIKHPNRAKQHHCGHVNARRACITNLTMHICGLLAGFIVIRFLIAGRPVAALPPPQLDFYTLPAS